MHALDYATKRGREQKSAKPELSELRAHPSAMKLRKDGAPAAFRSEFSLKKRFKVGGWLM
jgi:hypothetical protein